MKYKVVLMSDDYYQVVKLNPNSKYDENDFDCDEPQFFEEGVYAGSLSNCEAYIRLHEGGYM